MSRATIGFWWTLCGKHSVKEIQRLDFVTALDVVIQELPEDPLDFLSVRAKKILHIYSIWCRGLEAFQEGHRRSLDHHPTVAARPADRSPEYRIEPYLISRQTLTTLDTAAKVRSIAQRGCRLELEIPEGKLDRH